MSPRSFYRAFTQFYEAFTKALAKCARDSHAAGRAPGGSAQVHTPLSCDIAAGNARLRRKYLMRPAHVVLGIALGALLLGSGCGSPEKKLKGNIEDMTEILKDNADSPKEGAEELRSYVRSNLPKMMKAVGEAVVELDKIEDGKERAARLEEMQKELEDPIKEFMKAGEAFSVKARKDDDAKKYAKEVKEHLEKAFAPFEELGEIAEAI